MSIPLPKTESLLALLLLLCVSAPAAAQGTKVSKAAEERFYFAGGRLIRWLDNRGRAVAPGRGEYREAQARYLESSRLFVKGALSPNSTIEAPEPAP